MSKILEVFFELGLATTAYGFPNLIRSKRVYQKLLWMLFIIISTIFSGFLINETILSYLDYKVVSLIESVYDQPTEFPTITICPYMFDYFRGKNLKYIIKECSLGYDFSCSNNPDRFFESFNSEHGQCFRFNSGRNLTKHTIPIFNSTIGGVDDGFSLVLRDFPNVHVWIHNKSLSPNLIQYNNHFKERVFVSPNCYTEIVIHKVVETKLEEPYNNCLNDVTKFRYNHTIIDFIIENNQTYTQEKCIEWCFEIYFIEKNPCKCSNVELGNVWRKCWILIEKEKTNSCTWNFKVDFFSKSVVEKCSKYCPLECTSITYDIRSSMMLNIDTTKVKVYYDSLSYTSIRQEPKMQLIDLISNIGGTFGLLIGFSFVTFFEVIEILIEIIIISLDKLKFSNTINTK